MRTIWIPVNHNFKDLPSVYRIDPPLNEEKSKWTKIEISDEYFMNLQQEKIKLNNKNILNG